jgi:peptidoglycan/xylan/chitin deacetylase (PgdA/CDA1 family)
MSNLTNTIVLHQLTKDRTTSFESISVKSFEQILILTKGLTGLSSNIPNCKFVITFDDGHKSDIYYALPLLLKYKAKAIFFITIDFIGKDGYMNWDDIILLHKSGMEIGSHSLTHPHFKDLTKTQINKEFILSKKVIEKKLGFKISSFAFPYGSYTNKAFSLAREAGYKFLYTSKHGLISSSENECFARNSINSSHSNKNIHSILYPTLLVRKLWEIEDLIKRLIKILLGTYYLKIRNFFFS